MNILNMFKKPKTLQERYIAFMKIVQDASKKYGIDLVPGLNVKDLFAETTHAPAPTPSEATIQETPKNTKGGKKSGK